jgi:ABC-type glycerol-3-phosphate transport system substrate-binding protein
MKKALALIAISLLFAGCSNGKCSSCTSFNDEDDDILITQPVTNNPQLIPNHESAIPGMPGVPQ